MRRNISLEEISDGKLYELNDMVKADCHDCKGCSACCRGMGDSIVLDPLDICRLKNGLHIEFEEMLRDSVALGVVDGIILPHLQMQGSTEQCFFLNEEGRCSIHSFRPGICRLFPLGRYYENHSFRYFLQTNECQSTNRTKIKVRKWIDTIDIQAYEKFITDWHYFLLEAEETLALIATKAEDKDMISDDVAKQMNMYILNSFYIQPFEVTKFYTQFQDRLTEAEIFLKSLV